MVTRRVEDFVGSKAASFFFNWQAPDSTNKELLGVLSEAGGSRSD